MTVENIQEITEGYAKTLRIFFKNELGEIVPLEKNYFLTAVDENGNECALEDGRPALVLLEKGYTPRSESEETMMMSTMLSSK